MPFWGTFTATFGSGRRFGGRILDFLFRTTYLQISPGFKAEFETTDPKISNDIIRRLEYFRSGQITAAQETGATYVGNFNGSVSNVFNFLYRIPLESGGVEGFITPQSRGGILSIIGNDPNLEEVSFTAATIISGYFFGFESLGFATTSNRDEFLNALTEVAGQAVFKFDTEVSPGQTETYYIRSNSLPTAGNNNNIIWSNNEPNLEPDLDWGPNLMTNVDFSDSNLLQGWTAFPNANDLQAALVDPGLFNGGIFLNGDGLAQGYIEQDVSVVAENRYVFSFAVYDSTDPLSLLSVKIFDVNDGNNEIYSMSIGNFSRFLEISSGIRPNGNLLKIRVTVTAGDLSIGRFGLMKESPGFSSFPSQTYTGNISIYRTFQPRFGGTGVSTSLRDPAITGSAGTLALSFDTEQRASSFARSLSALGTSYQNLTVTFLSTQNFLPLRVQGVGDLSAYNFDVSLTDAAAITNNGTDISFAYVNNNEYGNWLPGEWNITPSIIYQDVALFSYSVDTVTNSVTVTLNSSISEALSAELLLGGGSTYPSADRTFVVNGTLTDLDGIPVGTENIYEFYGVSNVQGNGNTLTFNWGGYNDITFFPIGTGIIESR